MYLYYTLLPPIILELNRYIYQKETGVKIKEKIKDANIPPTTTALIADFIGIIDPNCGNTPSIIANDVNLAYN